MSRIYALVAVLVIAGAAYFGAQQMGWIGQQGMSPEDVAAALTGHAAEINAPDGVRYDDFSRLTAASVEGTTITITGVSLLNADQLDADYIDSRTGQAANKLCRDEVLRPVSEGGATFVYNWEAADGGALGTVTAGPTFCADQGA